MKITSNICKDLFTCHLKKAYPIFGKSRQLRYVSTNSAEENDIVVTEKLQLQKPQIAKWKRPPFAKNLFLGKVDIHLLPHQEAIDRENLVDLEKSMLRIGEIFKEKVNSSEIDTKRRISSDALQDLKEMGMFGRLVPVEYGGLGLSLTQYACLNEALSMDWSVGSSICAHELLGIQALLLFGSPAQKEKYLPELASGKKTVAFCCHEKYCGNDPSSIKTTAYVTTDQKNYILNGTKDWVTNVQDADLFVVFAQDIKYGAPAEGEITVFIIDKNTDGIKITPYNDTIGLLGTNCGSVSFSEVVVSRENVLGVEKSGNYMAFRIREWSRFGIGSLTFNVLKSFVDNVTDFVIHAERITGLLADQSIIKEKLSKLVSTIYAMESITYFTAGIFDTTENPDCAVETAIMKVFNTEGTLFCLRELMSILGCFSLSKTQQLEKFYRDARTLTLIDGGNDMARLFIGLSGCQHVGLHTAKQVEKYRNPFFYPMERLKLMRKHSRALRQKFDYTHDIAGHLHPSFVLQGNNVEECIQRLELITQKVLTDFGLKTIERQFEPIRLGDLVINLYARIAVLSRSSRSYCIGHKNSNAERVIAATFCDLAETQFKNTYIELGQGAFENRWEDHILIGEHVVKEHGYYPVHPLKYNY